MNISMSFLVCFSAFLRWGLSLHPNEVHGFSWPGCLPNPGVHRLSFSAQGLQARAEPNFYGPHIWAASVLLTGPSSTLVILSLHPFQCVSSSSVCSNLTSWISGSSMRR